MCVCVCVGVHVFGLCATALLTDIIQLSTGYHAPFFLTVCKPNYTLAAASCASNAYITRDICSGHDLHAIMAARSDTHHLQRLQTRDVDH